MAGLAIYPRLLGDTWADLPEPVRLCHEASPSLVASGTFTITCGTSRLARLARLAAWAGGMPRAGARVPIRLWVHAYEDHQVWSRDFEGAVMTTTQAISSDGQILRLRVRRPR